MSRHEAAIHAILILLAAGVLATTIYCLAALASARRPAAPAVPVAPVRSLYLQPIPLYQLPNYLPRHAS